MRLHAAALTGLMAVAVPSLIVPAEGAWGGWGYAYPYCGYGYGIYGYAPVYGYCCGYPAYREHRSSSHRYVLRRIYAAVRGVRRVRAFKSAAAASSSGAAMTGSPSLSSLSLSSPSISTVQPAPPANEPSTQAGSTAKELQQAKVDAINARASESMAQRKLADTEANLKQAKDGAARATQEAQQAKADAQAVRQSAETNLKQAKDEAARATKEAQQAKADAQAARQSKAEAERKLAESEAARTATEKQKQSQADPLGTWLRGLSRWLRRWGLVS
jgi:hypothetical protein